jgi:2-dehydro-3-deoxyphosphogluconate aldolase / (4S)-4-hydroxy-2-oxoglutarate aldolase
VARFQRLEVYRRVLEAGLVPLFHHDDPEVAWEVVRAAAAGGCPVLEFTNRGDRAHEVFADLERRCQRDLPEMALGAGSVLDAPTAGLYLNLGAAFVVAPTFDAEVARTCNRRKVAYMPGCTTPTEIARAEEAGCEIVKLFPGGAAGGPDLVRALRGPSPWTSLMPTGGVEPTEESLSAWFGAGAACVGMGSQLVSRDLVEAHDWDTITERIRATLALVARCRHQGAP